MASWAGDICSGGSVFVFCKQYCQNVLILVCVCACGRYPILATGGCDSADVGLQFIRAGAHAVQVGALNKECVYQYVHVCGLIVLLGVLLLCSWLA